MDPIADAWEYAHTLAAPDRLTAPAGDPLMAQLQAAKPGTDLRKLVKDALAPEPVKPAPAPAPAPGPAA